MLKDKKVISIGDKDGIPGPIIEACIKSAGAEAIFTVTVCFACSTTGAMDKENQQKIKNLALEYGAENIIVILGGAEAETSGLTAETLTAGDPTNDGPLAGIDLGLGVYHVFDPEIKGEYDSELYDEQCGMMEIVLNAKELINEVKTIREKYSRYSK